jgi:hypothetical protein
VKEYAQKPTARVMLYLPSAESAYVLGTELVVDVGMSQLGQKGTEN